MNKHRFVFPKTFLLTALFAASTCHLVAGSLYIGTVNNGAAWTVTLEGPSGDVTGTAFQSPDNSNISFSSDDKEDGTFVAGADAAAFDGAWYARRSALWCRKDLRRWAPQHWLPPVSRDAIDCRSLCQSRSAASLPGGTKLNPRA